MEEVLSRANKYLLDELLCEAKSLYEQVMSIDHPGILHNYALTHELMLEYDRAISLYKQNLVTYPNYVKSMIGIANCLRHTGKDAESLQWLEKAHGHPQTYFLLSAHRIRHNDINQGCLDCIMGMMKAAEVYAKDTYHYVQCYYENFLDKTYILRSGSATLLDFLYADNIPDEDILTIHTFYDTNYQTPWKGKQLNNDTIGFVSENFRYGSIMSNFIPLLENMTVKPICYDLGESVYHDDVTKRVLELSGHYRCGDVSFIRQKILEDAPKYLVSLDGHTGNGLTMKLMSERLAQYQIDYLGYPFSTGKKSIDYKIVCDMTDMDGKYYTEKLLRINPFFFCWKPLIQVDTPFPDYVPCQKILAPNNFKKMSPMTLSMFQKILDLNPNIEIHFKSSLESGIKPLLTHDRVVFLHRTEDPKEHYTMTSKYDLVLDTFPYNGTITTLESLYCGVPVVTLQGVEHRSRVSASLLNILETPELIATSPEEYVDIATSLIQSPQRLIDYHSTLRNKLIQSPLMNGREFAKAFEKCLASICD